MPDTIAYNREDGGRLIRDLWIERARQHPHPKASWLVEWDELNEWDKETNRFLWDRLTTPYIGEIVELTEECTRKDQVIQRFAERVNERNQEIKDLKERVKELEESEKHRQQVQYAQSIAESLGSLD